MTQFENQSQNRRFFPVSDILEKYDNDKFIRIFMVLDTDIVVLLVNLMALFFYLKGENHINEFLQLNFWSIFNRIYFSFLLLINPVILYVFYITETRITFNILNCYLYSFSCGIVLFTLVILFYAIFELPFKKFIKLFLKNFEIKVTDKRFDYMENNSLILQQMEVKGKLVRSKTNSVYEDENENENEDEEENLEENNEIKLKENFIDNNNDKENENEL